MDEYKQILKELSVTDGVVPTVWREEMYSTAKEFFSEDKEGYKVFNGRRIYFVKKDGTLIDWRDIENV